MDKGLIKFTGTLNRVIYSNGDYKICALDVDCKKYPHVSKNKYNNVSITGNIPSLSEGLRYRVVAKEENNKYGISYNVVSLSPDKPIGFDETYSFLCEILTYTQATVLYRVYPNIIDELIENPDKKFDLSKTKGIKEKTFEKIKEKILENYLFIDLINEFQGMIKLEVLKKMFYKYGSIEAIRAKILDDPYKCISSMSGFGFKTADNIILNMASKGYDFGYDIKHSLQRCKSYIEYVISEKEQSGDTYIELNELKKNVLINIPECKDKFVEAIKSEMFHLDKSTLSISNKRTYVTEKYIANTISKMLDKNIDKYEFEIEKYRVIDGYNLSDDQLKILDVVSDNSISILSGYSGCGKTTAINGLLNMLDDLGKSYLLLSPTAKAAKVIKQATKREAKTIHRGLRYSPPMWEYNEDNKLVYDIFILDEFSMCDIFLFKHLLEAIDINKSKLLLIGDPSQLPSVACGNLLDDMINSNKVPTVFLKDVFRYGEGGLMKAATDVRNCKEYLGDISKKVTKYGDNEDYVFIQSQNEQTIDDIILLYKKLLTTRKVEDIQVLTAYKVGKTGTIELNKKLQKIANKNYGCENSVKAGDNVFYEGDMVIQKINNYKARPYKEDCFERPHEVLIANGETGFIESIDLYNNMIIINFDGVKIMYSKEDMSMLNLGYALSIHSSQGSTIPIVILSTPKSQYHMLSSNLIYVGMTRIKEKCYHVGDKSVIDKVIHKKDNLLRKTYLKNLLQNI